MMKISSIVVLGGGSAGLIAALTLKRKLPHLKVRVIRSPGIGVIGVGEGTTVAFPRHLFEYLKLDQRRFYKEAAPTWKMGVRFLWGARKSFCYTLSYECEQRLPQLSRNNGYYYRDDYPWLGPASAFMSQGKVFPRKPNGMPMFHGNYAFHIENETLVSWLGKCCQDEGVIFTDATVRAERGESGIEALVADSGERITSDLYIDASGFRSELVGRTLEEPFMSFDDALFCDRAVVGGWERTDEPILSYTTSETMDAGWCWQIEHEQFINRGYVYGSAFISDDKAQEEFLRKNPKVTSTRIVKFRTGRVQRNWVGNVVAIGNASGFVEPLEATALMVVCNDATNLTESIKDCLCEPTPSLVKLYNRYTADTWDDIRNFLALHYAFNTISDTPFWQACRADTKLHAAQDIVNYYRQNGPSFLGSSMLVHPGNPFRLDGYLTVLVGMGVPYEKPYSPPPDEGSIWLRYVRSMEEQARQGMDVREALNALRTSSAWNEESQQPASQASR